MVMANPKKDRRSQRTKRILVEALASLIQEKRYELITVQNIIDRADVGRSTFYEHYRDKEDLMASMLARNGCAERMVSSSQDWQPTTASHA
jgi:AcrR family transcriptional regulator